MHELHRLRHLVLWPNVRHNCVGGSHDPRFNQFKFNTTCKHQYYVTILPTSEQRQRVSPIILTIAQRQRYSSTDSPLTLVREGHIFERYSRTSLTAAVRTGSLVMETKQMSRVGECQSSLPNKRNHFIWHVTVGRNTDTQLIKSIHFN